MRFSADIMLGNRLKYVAKVRRQVLPRLRRLPVRSHTQLSHRLALTPANNNLQISSWSVAHRI